LETSSPFESVVDFDNILLDLESIFSPCVTFPCVDSISSDVMLVSLTNTGTAEVMEADVATNIVLLGEVSWCPG
jgi:hypothetical protein